MFHLEWPWSELYTKTFSVEQAWCLISLSDWHVLYTGESDIHISNILVSNISVLVWYQPSRSRPVCHSPPPAWGWWRAGWGGDGLCDGSRSGCRCWSSGGRSQGRHPSLGWASLPRRSWSCTQLSWPTEKHRQSNEGSPTFPGELEYLEKSAGYPLIDFEKIFEFNLLSVLIVSKERSVWVSHLSLK